MEDVFIDAFLIGCIGVILMSVNSEIVEFFCKKWRRKDDELPPLMERHKKRMVVFAVITFIIFAVGVSLGLLFQRQRLLFIVVSLFLGCSTAITVAHHALQYVSLRKEIAERKLSRSEQA
ncbi:MAG: hypothetical protein LBL45_11845 [Treponema sp.]|jgi:sulfite exporter TauE/SafE|nr:hypothetical protein [Treponema sp.]